MTYIQKNIYCSLLRSIANVFFIRESFIHHWMNDDEDALHSSARHGCRQEMYVKETQTNMEGREGDTKEGLLLLIIP